MLESYRHLANGHLVEVRESVPPITRLGRFIRNGTTGKACLCSGVLVMPYSFGMPLSTVSKLFRQERHQSSQYFCQLVLSFVRPALTLSPELTLSAVSTSGSLR